MSIAKTGISLGGALLALAVVGTAQTFQPFTPDIPKAWDDQEVARFELPLVQRDRSPRYMTSEADSLPLEGDRSDSSARL